ncbi:SapC family protein [Rhodobacteraceae bacterium B1Z28]|uniref:SapC family protein n=1 Tax=Ruegeria haliotis TaxID=2747601 RepID=A0ABX2PUC3_9RHOB|nr:SapC family protein [Ruegeria haliotis]NVO57775.1 SapC family protein [Ruegeria haliotis]
MAQNGLTPISYPRHGHRFWRRFTSYEFARNVTDCPVVETEILQIAAALPIAFRSVAEGHEPVAILSLIPESSTPFVSGDGAWLAPYVPSALRCPPFHVSRVKACENEPKTQLQLLVDETLGLLTDDPTDEAFFDPTGELTPELQKILAFFQARTVAADETFELCRIIDGMKLFTPLTRHLGMEYPPGLLGINSRALRDLPQAQKAVLTNSEALRLIHAHQVSLSHTAWLMRAQQQARQHSPHPKSGELSDVSGFLDAMASAQQTEEMFAFHEPERFHADV